ncbi:MAG: methyltransferase domain-containing protein, partial [Actinomycetota bacterium]
MLTRRTKCRLCESGQLVLSVELPLTTIADHYRATGEKQMPLYPLDIYRCEACGHIQLLDILPPAVLFDAEFTYMPSKNPALIEHFKMYSDLVANLLDDHSASVCLDIGSNDGLFLQTLKARFGSEILGIDPAHAPAEHARSQGVETWEEFFSDDSVRRIKDRFKKIDVISANNVFAHNDDLISFATNVVSLMHDGSVFSFEFSYLVDVVEKGLIGTVFHEHVSTHSLLSLIPFLNRCGLDLVDIKRINTQGG